MKETLKRLVVCMIVALLALTPAAVVSAHDGEDHEDGDTSVSSTEPQQEDRVNAYKERYEAQLQKAREAREKTADRRADLKERLTDAKKRICQNRQNVVNKVMNNMNDRRERVFERLTKITDAVKGYVSEKNLDVAGYSELVAAVEAASVTAHDAMHAQQSVPQLDCSGEHPRADVVDFKEKRLESIQAMKAYRDAVKALVKTVKAAAQQQEESKS